MNLTADVIEMILAARRIYYRVPIARTRRTNRIRGNYVETAFNPNNVPSCTDDYCTSFRALQTPLSRRRSGRSSNLTRRRERST